MLVLDLRSLVFAGLLGLVAVVSLTVVLHNWLAGRSNILLFRRGLATEASTIENCPFGFLLLKGTDTYSYANSYARQLLGLEATSGRLPNAKWVQLLAADREALRRGESGTTRYRKATRSPDVIAGGGDSVKELGRALQWWVTPGGRLDQVFLLDATVPYRAEAAAQSLLNDASHELRTPIATILTHLEVLSLPKLSTEIGQQSIRLLKAEARRMARMVHLMLELGRLDTSAGIERQPVDLLRVVEGVIAQLSPEASERKMVLSLESDSPLPMVLGDEDRLQQVFLNLVDNAVKYCRPGDKVLISLRQGEDGVHCAVSDNGPGIPAEHLPFLTRRFYRVAPQETEGSGLGLALVAEILRYHHTTLRIDSQTTGPTTGTCARFVLPVLASVPEPFHARGGAQQ